MGLHIIFIIAYFVLSNLVSGDVLCMMLLLQCGIGLIAQFTSRQRPLYLMVSYYSGVIIATAANLIFIYKVNTAGFTEYTMYRYIVPECIDEAMLLWCVGNSAIFVGYMAFQRSSLPSIRFDIVSRKTLDSLFMFSLLSGLLTLTGNAINLAFISGGLSKVLSLLGIGGIVYYARLWTRENSRTYRQYALILWALHTGIALYVSFLRTDLLVPSFGLYVGYFLGKGDIRYVLSYRIIPALLIVIIFATFFQNFGGHRSRFINTFTEDVEAREASPYTQPVNKTGTSAAIERSSNLAQLTCVVKLTQKNGFYGGRASLPLVAAFVPRFLWPDKPNIQLGAWFALEIGVASLTDAGRANNSINMTIPGQLFLDFGYIGLVLGCFFFGWLLALFWNASEFSASPYNLIGTMWGSYLLLYAIWGMGADLQIIVSLISTYIVFLILKKILSGNANISRRATLARK